MKKKQNIIFEESLKSTISKKSNNPKEKKKIINIFNNLIQEKEKIKNNFYYLSKRFKLNFDKKDIDKFQKYQTVAIIGMGGSILGSKAIYKFFEGVTKKRFIFFDNLDLYKIELLKNKLNLQKVLIIIISKSGNTLETLSIFNLLKNKKINNKNTIIITENKHNSLQEFSKKYKIYMVAHKNYVGGRYSVLTETGMLPAYLMGLHINNFRKNLSSATKVQGKILFKILPLMKKIYLSKKYNTIIFLNYCPKLNDFLFWCQQLMAESLGKNGKGLLPVISVAPRDHHSLLQLYLDGPKDKLFYFFSQESSNISGAKKNIFDKSFGKIKSKNIDTIVEAQKKALVDVFKKKKIPFREFRMLRLNEESLGELFSYFMIETALIGKMLNIDPFNQPAVEEVKIQAMKNLS